MISDAFIADLPTPSVGADAIAISDFVVADCLSAVHSGGVLTRDQLLERLNAKVDRKEIRNVDIARALGLPDSRIPALLRGERRIFFDEATRLVQAFELEQDPAAEPLRASILRLAVLHIARRLGLKVEEPALQELAEDLRAFSVFAANPKVRQSVEAAEGFFQALQLRRPEAEEEARQGSDPATSH